MVSKFFTKICCIFLFTTPLTYCRVYNIEDDAVAIYGEHFDEVLRKFRRTPNYLEILQARYATMLRYFEEITVQVMQSIETKITQRVTEIVKGSRPGPTTTTTTTPEGQPAFFRSGKVARRQDSNEEQTTQDPIVSLDGYYLLHRLTTTKERNDFRQLGFDMARQMVQLIIKGMGPVAERQEEQFQSNLFPNKSTMAPSGNNANPSGSGNPPPNGHENDHGNLLGTASPPPIARKS